MGLQTPKKFGLSRESFTSRRSLNSAQVVVAGISWKLSFDVCLKVNPVGKPVALGLFRMPLAIVSPVTRIGFGPDFVTHRLIKSIIRVGAHFKALPGRLARSLAGGIWAVTLILVPDTACKHISAAAANNLFHGCHRSLMIEGLGLKLERLRRIIWRFLFY